MGSTCPWPQGQDSNPETALLPSIVRIKGINTRALKCARHSIIASYYYYNTLLPSTTWFAERSHREHSGTTKNPWGVCLALNLHSLSASSGPLFSSALCTNQLIPVKVHLLRGVRAAVGKGRANRHHVSGGELGKLCSKPNNAPVTLPNDLKMYPRCIPKDKMTHKDLGVNRFTLHCS